MKSLEQIIERIILAARWILVVFYIGLGLGLTVYAAAFVLKLGKLSLTVFTATNEEMILAMLSLIDAALVASLLVMVMLSGYETFISRIDNPNAQLSWLGKLDASALKVKLAASIIAISSIHLLQVFLNIEHYQNNQVFWVTGIHLTFLVSAMVLAVLDRLAVGGKNSAKTSLQKTQ